MMSKEKRRVPKLRFPGFTEDWEQRKLGDVADVRDGTHDSPKFYNDGFPLVTSKNLKDGSIDFSDCSFISKQDFDEINKRSKVDSGDILFGMIGTIGNPAIVEHTGFAIKNVALIKEGIIVNNRFIYHLLSSKVFDNYIARENAGGTQKFIALNQIRNFIFLAPTLEEQNKIIELLDYISQTITLHQRKLNNLKLKRKALLQKLFPKNGEGYPELRFPGFTDAWEQRKLGDFYTFKNGLNKEKVYFGYGDSIVNFTDVFHNRQIYSSTLKGKVCVNKKELENYKVKEGDLFFTRTSETIDEIGFPAVVMEPMERVVFSGFVLRGRAEKYDPLANIFKSYIFFTDNFRSEMKKKSSMTTRALTSGTALKEMCFSYPKDLEEQTKIGEILLSLDKIITLHQRKLKHLQIQKKSLLQKLFV